MLFTLTLPTQNPFAKLSFLLIPSPPAPCDAGSVYHRLNYHGYYGFIRLLIQITLLERESTYALQAYVSAPSRGATRDALVWLSRQVIPRLPLILWLNSVTHKLVGCASNFKEDVMRPPSVTQESIRSIALPFFFNA